MSEEIAFGLEIMAIGMITVFTILSLVIIGGKIMILAINKFDSDTLQDSSPTSDNQQIDNIKISVLSSVVATVTGGKGKITHIKKL